MTERLKGSAVQGHKGLIAGSLWFNNKTLKA